MPEYIDPFKEYFLSYYQKDMEVYRGIYNSTHQEERLAMCSHSVHTILSEKLYEKFHNFEYFILCNYEFNLIIQVVYTHFRHNWSIFKELLPDFIYLEAGANLYWGGCSLTTPWELIYQFKVRAKELGYKSFEFSNKDRLDADLFFKEYLIELFEKNPKLDISWEIFVQAMLGDEDIQNELKRLARSR